MKSATGYAYNAELNLAENEIIKMCQKKQEDQKNIVLIVRVPYVNKNGVINFFSKKKKKKKHNKKNKNKNQVKHEHFYSKLRPVLDIAGS